MPLATIYQFNSGRQFIGGAVLHIYSSRFVGVKVSVLTQNVVARGFEPWSGQNKAYEIGIR